MAPSLHHGCSEPCRVRVYDAEKFQQLLGGGGGEPQQRHKARGRIGASVAKKAEEDLCESAAAAAFERRQQEASRRQAEASRAVRERIEENKARKERRFQARRGDIARGRELAEEIDEYLTLYESEARLKQKKQFDDWNSNVYGAIREQICDKLDAVDPRVRNERRRREFQQYLDVSNTKGAIFRDIILESEYDPLEPNRRCIKYDSDKLRDPVKRVLDKHAEEAELLSPRKKKNAVTVREMLQPTAWGAGKIEATPHGYFARLTDDACRDKRRDQNRSKTHSSRVLFDHYNVAIGPDATNSEFPLGKRTSYHDDTKSDRVLVG